MRNSVNLLPLEFRQRTLLTTRIRQWLTAFTICAVCMLIAIGLQWRRLSDQEKMLSMKRAQARPFREMEKKLVGMNDELARLHSSRSLLAEARRSTQTVKLLGLVSQSANDNLQVQSLEFKSQLEKNAEPAKPKQSKGEKAETPTVRTELVLSGVASDNLAISQLLAGLKSGQIFDSVDVKKISNTTSNASILRSYNITCRIDEATQ